MSEPTLLQFFDDAFMHPVLVEKRGASVALIIDYRRAADWWMRLMPDVAVSEIGRSHVEVFYKSLRTQVGWRLARKLVDLVRVLVAAAQVRLEQVKEDPR